MPQRLDERPVGDALAVGDAATQRYVGAVPDPGEELADQPRLPDPRWPEHGDHLTAPGAHRPVEGVVQGAVLLGPSDQRHVLASPPAVEGVEHPQQAVCRHRLGLALGPHVRNRLDLDRVADQGVRRRAEQDLPVSGRLLQARGRVDRVAGRERAPCPSRAGHHRSGVDARPDRQPHTEFGKQLPGQDGDRVVQLVSRPHGPQRVILMHHGDAEHGEHRVADELLDRPAVTLDGRARHREVTAQHPAKGLRVQLLAHRRGAGHVGEQQRHRAAGLTLGGGGHGSTTLEAELHGGRELCPARRTCEDAGGCPAPHRGIVGVPRRSGRGVWSTLIGCGTYARHRCTPIGLPIRLRGRVVFAA